MTRLNFVLGLFASGFVAVSIAAFWLALAAPFVLVPRGKRERLVMWTNRAASVMILRYALLAKLDVKGRENLPPAPYLVVSNHRGFCDVLTLIWAANAEGVSKRLVLYFPMMGVLGYLGGAVFFDRTKPEERSRAKRDTLFQLASGNNMHLYPEGTRAREGLLREKLHWGLVHAAYEQGVTVVPAGLWGTDHVIPITNEGVRYGQTIRARFGTPVLAKDHQTPDAFTEAIWGQVRELVSELAYSAAPPTSNM